MFLYNTLPAEVVLGNGSELAVLSFALLCHPLDAVETLLEEVLRTWMSVPLLPQSQSVSD